MVGVSVVQVGSAVRHTPLAPLSYEIEPILNSEEPNKNLRNGSSQFSVLGGFVGGGQLAWRAFGPTVEVIEPNTGTRKAAWTFGAILHNAGARVTSVCGVGPGTISQVIVGVDLGADRKPQGMVALLCLCSSRLTRVFHFEHKVTSLCMVSGGEVSVDPGTLAPELRPWHGLLVVGTAHGTLHLLDLALDFGGHKVLSDEVSPGNLVSVVTPDPQAERTRISAVMQHCHPTMCLSDSMSYAGRFHLIGPDDNILFEISSHLVTTTALAFIPQLASLIVGYSFGAFQIINLSSLTIDCTSPYEDKMPPVYSFACQEPENDPKNFVYLWLCRSWSSADGGRESRIGKENSSHALCTMYAMNYDNKVWIEGHGLWYQGLASISPRFEFDAIGGLGLKGQPAKPSVVFAAMTVRQTTPNSAATPGGTSSVSALATPDEDSGPVPEQSLCLFGWIGGVLEHGQISVNHYLAVFDINQWYQAQMPSTMKLEESHLCPYMSFHELDKVPGGNVSEGLSEIVLGAAPKPASWARHMSRTCNDSDWFPAALSYDAHVLTSEGLMEYRCQSAQQAALTHLTSCGPSAIVSPEDAYAMCVFAGLISPDAHPNTTGSYMVIEREALLNVALDQQLVSLLVQCVAEFSEGRFTNLGCSLPSLLEWSWSRVCAIKTTNDNLCLPLFDPDCGVMSTESIAVLHQNLTSLASLTTIITAIRDYASTNMITLKGAGELENRVQVVGLLMLHLSVVLWFYHCGLLSHTPTEDVIEDCHVPFPADLLCRIYKNRRSEVQRLSSALAGNEVLMIDGLLADTSDSCESIGKAWEKDGGSGMYPPPSLHALLAIFLLPDVSTTTKHRIVQYLFLDLASLLSDGYVRVVEELVKYPSSFSLSPSHIKLTQAFWLLDHKDFQEGLNVLLDPLVNTNDITPWQHRRIMKAFLYQGEHSRALTYAQIRQPPKVDLDDVRLHLTLLLANGLIREAFHYQRSHRNKNNSEDLLNHLFTGCEQLGKLECVVHLPLSSFEEEAFVSYLHTSSNPSAHDYLLVYYLQRARYDDAAVLQDSLRGGVGTAKKRQGARSALVHGYLTHLPDVAKRLTSGAIRRNEPIHSIYKKPQPLSAQIRQALSRPVSLATGINRKLEQSQEAWPLKLGSTPYTPFRNKSQRRKALEPIESEDFGGLFTPKRKTLISGETSHVVFPSRVQASYSKYTEEEDGEVGLFSPASKRIRLGESSHMRDDVSKLMESVLRRSFYGGNDANASVSKSMSSDLMSLLQTPKIMRKGKSGARPSTESSLVDTPQSILKVRQMVQRPLSPSPASETSIPVFPRISNKKATISEDLLPGRASDTSMTPKQLRFHLPKMRVDEESFINEKVEAEKNVEEILIEHEGEQELEDEVRGTEEENGVKEDRIKDSEIVQDIEGSKEECGQELEEEGVTQLEEEEEEVERDLEQKAVFIPPYPDTNNHSENPRRNPDSGIPTPRQPLHGCVAKRVSVAAVLHKSDTEKCIDEVEAKETQEEEQEESLECISHDTTINEIYYSFTEEPSTVGDSEDKHTIEDEDEELEGAERSKEVGDSEDDFAIQDDENIKEGEKEIICTDEFCPKEEQEDEPKLEKEEDLLYEGLNDEVETTDGINQETEKDMVDEGSEKIDEVETTNAINQETEGGSEEVEVLEITNEINQEAVKVYESTSLLKGQTLDTSSDKVDKVDNLSSSEDSVEETEQLMEEVTDMISNSANNEIERRSEDESELSLDNSEVMKVLELSGSEPEESDVKEKLSSKEKDIEKIEQQMEENADNASGSPEEKDEDELELSLNESEIISPLEFSESESDPEESSSVEEKLTFKEIKDHAREKKVANEELATLNQQSAIEKLVISSDENPAVKLEEIATKEQPALRKVEHFMKEMTTSAIEEEQPTTQELESAIKDKVTTEEQKLATEECELTTMENLGKGRELVMTKDVPFTEGGSATVEEELPLLEKQQYCSMSGDANKEKEIVLEETENLMTDLSENNQELIMEADYQITEEEQEMITEAMTEGEGICLTLEAPEHFSPLCFSDSENEDEDIMKENLEEKGTFNNDIEHISNSETKSVPTKVTLPLSECQDVRLPERSIFESKIMKVNNSEEQSKEANISEGRGDVANATKIEHEAAVEVGETPAAVVPIQCENSRVTKMEEVLISGELLGNRTFTIEMIDATRTTTTAMDEECPNNLRDHRVESSAIEETPGKSSIPKDIEILRLSHEIQAKENNKSVSSEEEMLPLEDQTTKPLGNEYMHEKLGMNKSSENILLRNYDNEMGILEREDTEMILPKTEGEYKGMIDTNNSNVEVLKNLEHDKESLKSHEKNVDLKTEIENADLEKEVYRFESQIISKTSSKEEKEESASLESESMEPESSIVTKEQRDELTATSQEKCAGSTPVSEETIASISPRNTAWRKSAGSPTEVSEEVPMSTSPRECSKQIENLETAVTVIEEIGLTMSPKSLEYADGDITETTKETTPTGSIIKDNEEATMTVSTRRSLRHSYTAVSFTAATKETGIRVSPRKRSEQSYVMDRGNLRLSNAKDIHTAADVVEADSNTTETTTTASLKKTFKGVDANIDTKTERQETISVSSHQNSNKLEATSSMTSPVKSLRQTHTPKLQTTLEEDTAKVPDTSKTTPLRRSLRIRASSPYTPGTPKKTRKSIKSTEATTPVRASSQESGDEMITRSGRKIRLVATPVTKSKSSAPGSPLVTPRKSVRDSDITEEMQKVSQKLELSSGVARHDLLATPPGSPTLPSNRKQHTMVTNEPKAVVTPSKLLRRRSTRQSTSDEVLETIKEEREKAILPKSSENEEEDAFYVTTKMTPSKLSTKSTPRRRRSSRQSIVSENLETIEEDTEISSTGNQVFTEEQQTLTSSHRTLQRSKTSQRTRQSVGGNNAETPERKTPQRRRRSVAGDVTATPEKKTPRRRWHSFTDNVTKDIEQREILHEEEDSLGSVFHAVENKTPSSKGRSPLPVTDVRRSARRQRHLSQSKDSRPEVEESEITALKTNILPSLEVLESTPDRRTTISSESSTITSMKDSESSEDDNTVKKKHFSRRKSGGNAVPHLLVDEQDRSRRKSRRLTLSSTLSMAGKLQLQEPSVKPSQKYLKSLKIHCESDETASLLTPDSDFRGHSRKHRKSCVSSNSILLIEDPSKDEELIIEHGLDIDTSRDADDEGKYAEVQESPDLSLNLIEVVGKGKKKRKSSLSHLSVSKRGRRRTLVPRHSLQSLKIHTESSQDQEDVVEARTRRSQRYKCRSTNKSAIEIQDEKNQEVKIRTAEKEEEEEEDVNIKKEGGGKATTTLVTVVKECKDKSMEKKLDMIEAEATLEQEEKKAEESTTQSLTPQFEFAKPKSVTSSRRVRALEYLTSEAVEFLFSPPQAAGRIVRHHARVEEGAKTNSSESETESDMGRRMPVKRQK